MGDAERAAAHMRTERLSRDENGQYAGSLASQGELSGEERSVIRRTLAKNEEPLHLSQLAAMCGIAMTDPAKAQNFGRYIEQFLVSAGEVEMAFGPGRQRRGQPVTEIFRGWRATKALVSRVEKGLA